MGRFKLFFLALVAVAGLLLGGCGDDNDTIVVVPYNGKYIYATTDSVPNYVSGFSINSDGSLESLPGSPFLTGGNGAGGGNFANMPIALARDSKLLFAANLADSTITSFTLNSSTGVLTAVGVPVASGGTMGSGALVVDDGENFLFAGNDTTGDISVFGIAANGVLTPVGAPFSLGVLTGTNGMAMNAIGTTLYVALPDTNQLAVLSVAADGTLSHIVGSPFAFEVDSFVLATSKLGFSGTAGTGAIASYSIDSFGEPTQLDSILVGSNNQCVTTARRGKLAILSGGGAPSINVIAVAADGTLTPVVGSPFATTIATNGYATVNPSGKHLYATERTHIEAFRIDSAGALTSLNTYELLPGFVGNVRATLTVIY